MDIFKAGLAGPVPTPAFDQRSRYAALANAPLVHVDERGREIPYVPRRILPRGDSMPTLAELAVGPGERLDLVAARGLGDPELFWRICDANDAMNPFDLVAECGGHLRVPLVLRPG